MGIPGLFKNFIKDKVRNSVKNFVPKFVSSLALDLNGVFHDARNFILGAGVTDNETLKAIKRKNPDQIDFEIRFTILEYILEIVMKIKPRDCLLLCIDGPAPHAKLQQQKIRRQSSETNPLFDGNAITPGTEFMMRLHDDIITFLERKKNILPPKIIYSSHLVPGEGEHKIMDYYRSGELDFGLAAKQGAPHVLYGLDADLIMLSLLSPLKNILLYQERMEFDKRIQQKALRTYVININAIKMYLTKASKNSSVIQDFVVMSFLIGNDFLPHFPVFHDIGETLLKFIDIYIESNITLTNLDSENDPSINWVGFRDFILVLANQEEDMLIDIASNSDEFFYPSTFIENAIGKDREGNEIFDYGLYRSNWYDNALGTSHNQELTETLRLILDEDIGLINPSDITIMVKQYLLMLAWNYLYYTKGTFAINRDLYYPYHHSPLLTDITAVLNNIMNNNDNIIGHKAKNQMINFNALHQLVAVMPLRSKHLLPIELHPLFDHNSIIRDIFPKTFITEKNGLKYESMMGLSIIPPVDRRRIYEAVREIEFTPNRAIRWLPQTDKKYERTETSSEKSAREIAKADFLEARKVAFEKKNKSKDLGKRADKNIAEIGVVTQVPLNKEKESNLKNLDILSSYGIVLGKNAPVDKFATTHKINIVKSKISEVSKPPSLAKNKNLNIKELESVRTPLLSEQTIIRSPARNREIQEPIMRIRNKNRDIQEPIIRNRSKNTNSESISEREREIEQEPIIRNREIQEPIIRTRKVQVRESALIPEPIIRNRNVQEREPPRIQEPIIRTRTKNNNKSITLNINQTKRDSDYI
jgi:5'-3' exoribonuclease 1